LYKFIGELNYFWGVDFQTKSIGNIFYTLENMFDNSKNAVEKNEIINGITITTYIIKYDEKTDFEIKERQDL